MMPRDIFRTSREKLQPVFVIEQDNRSPYAAALSRKPLQNQKFKLQDSLPPSMEPPLFKRKKIPEPSSAILSADPPLQPHLPLLNQNSIPTFNIQTYNRPFSLQSSPQLQNNGPQTNEEPSPVKKETHQIEQEEREKASDQEFVNPAPFSFANTNEEEQELNLQECLARLEGHSSEGAEEIEPEQILQKILKQSLKWDLKSGDYQRHYRETCGLSDYQVLRRIEDIGEVARQQDEQMLTLQREMQRSGVIRFQ